MTDREKLAYLLANALQEIPRYEVPQASDLADHLIANGVVVREKGEWVKEGPYTSVGGDYKKALLCPLCYSYFVSDGNTPWQLHDFCPNCGADMRGDNNGR